jgi:hypothetical protein
MFQLVHQYDLVTSRSGKRYRPRAFAELQLNGIWSGWLVFFPLGPGAAVATDLETTQTSMTALADWAAGISPAYLELALERALERGSDSVLRFSQLERIEADALAVADTLQEMAATARQVADIAAEGKAEAAADDRAGDAAAPTSERRTVTTGTARQVEGGRDKVESGAGAMRVKAVDRSAARDDARSSNSGKRRIKPSRVSRTTSTPSRRRRASKTR